MLQKTMARLACYSMSLVSKKKGTNTLFGPSLEEEIPVITNKINSKDTKDSGGKYKRARLESALMAIGLVGLGTLIGAAYAVGERRSIDVSRVDDVAKHVLVKPVAKPAIVDNAVKEEIAMVNVIPNKSFVPKTPEQDVIPEEAEQTPEQEAPELVVPESEMEPEFTEAEQARIGVLERKIHDVLEKTAAIDQDNLRLKGKLEMLVVKNRALSDQLLNIDHLTESLEKKL